MRRAKNRAAEPPKLAEHDPFVGLWQRVIGLLSSVTDEFDAQWQQRWGSEELYKISKKLIIVDDFHARTERGVKQELFADFVLLTLNRILANHAEAGLNANSATKSDARRFQVNIKNALVTMVRHLEELFLSQIRLTCKTLNTVIDALGFCRQKTRPGRKYPRVSMKPVGKWRPSKA